MSGEKGLISYCLIQIYTLLSGCQPKSRHTGFPGPEGELAILNPQSKIEQLIEFGNFGQAIQVGTKKGWKEENRPSSSNRKNMKFSNSR